MADQPGQGRLLLEAVGVHGLEVECRMVTPMTCTCPVADAWRCAVIRRLSTVACSCRCHRSHSYL